ncbi:hypothetical protein RM863_35270 [Streptomyces sp. DSM 41014]|uniref:Uncharacterized protein n=1 Tax=Streptomyces hintoniae TaxID=3075521 RepID=A0ABU2UVS2_9ACTN|nr:hypothetical protein [Streptomyces sp. DSM 41014]MDT0477396.1 hypothetical protein [Streptomyces sp. DSM 41014]
MLPPLATPADATGYDYPLPADRAVGLLAKASARIRRAAGHQITAQTAEVRFPVSGGMVTLAGGPVLGVTAVRGVADDGTAGEQIPFVWSGGEKLAVPLHQFEQVDVTYRFGYEVLPDGLVELACQVAFRLSQQPAQGEGMLRTASVDDASFTYASEQIAAAGDLMPGERRALDGALGTPGVSVVKSRGRR